MAQLVARLHGMQKVRGSNPLSSTDLPDVRSNGKCQAKCQSVFGPLFALVTVYSSLKRSSITVAPPRISGTIT
jgi:hypothetical protein